jgi:hypothetical protein
MRTCSASTWLQSTRDHATQEAQEHPSESTTTGTQQAENPSNGQSDQPETQPMGESPNPLLGRNPNAISQNTFQWLNRTVYNFRHHGLTLEEGRQRIADIIEEDATSRQVKCSREQLATNAGPWLRLLDDYELSLGGSQ